MIASDLTLVLTNDDGIDAPGLATLVKATDGLAAARVVVAPVGAQSGCGHAVTTHKPIAIDPRGAGRFAIDGTPADCVRLALHHLASGVSLVISGINAGGNLGGDVPISGTVAAAREAASHGIAAIAVSHYLAKGRAIDWDQAERWTGAVIARLIMLRFEPGTFWNVNLPHPAPGSPEPEIVFCEHDPSPMPLAYEVAEGGGFARFRGDYHARARRPGGDIEVCFGGNIAVSRLMLGGG